MRRTTLYVFLGVFILSIPAMAAEEAGHKCAMMAPAGHEAPHASPSGAGHMDHENHIQITTPSGEGDIGMAIKSAMRGGAHCRRDGIANICPLAGQSILRHGPCCAAECRTPPSGPERAANASIQTCMAPNVGLRWSAPDELILSASDYSKSIPTRSDAPEPRPPIR